MLVGTKIVAATFENEIGSEEVFCDRVWGKYGFCDSRQSDYGMEKVNYAENTILYLNQAYLTAQKKKQKNLCFRTDSRDCKPT